MKLLNDPRFRSILAGAIGGLLGWTIAEALCGPPHSFIATLAFGLFAGLGIGAVLGVSEGAVLLNWPLALRGALIGLTIGAAGGAVGAGFGQVGWSITAAPGDTSNGTGQGSVFSTELKERLEKAGAQSGEIEIGLIWKNRNDLDLHVVDPNDERISFENRKSASGGELDVDRNADCRANVTNEPVEHVFWPYGTAPEGTYRVYVHHFKKCGENDPTPFQIEVIVGNRRETLSGTTSYGDAPQLVHTFPRTPPTSGSIGMGPILARILGWTVFGVLVGAAEGFRRRSKTAARNAGIGGALGGAVGGLAFEVIARVVLPLGFSDVLPRFLGIVILGACIGLSIVIIEQALSAVLSVRSGRHEGREIFLDKPEMRIGRNEVLEIYLGGDPEITSHHATIRQEGAAHVIVPEGGTVTVNGSQSGKSQLRNGDTIIIGKTRLGYKHKAAPGADGGQQPSKPPETTTAAPRQGPRKPPPPPPRKRDK